MIKISRHESIKCICNLAGATVISVCAVNPVTGRREFMLMSNKWKLAWGSMQMGIFSVY